MRARGGRALAGRRDVVPLAAELVVGDDHHRALRAAAVLDRAEQVDEVVAARVLAGVAGMLVLRAERLDEADLLEPAAAVGVLRVGDELSLVAKVLRARVGA